MNKLTMIGLALAVAAVAFTGCVTKPVVSTAPNGASVTNFQRVPDVERIARLAGAAAELGSQAWINEHPNDRRYFVVANESLKGLVNQANYDPAAFANALQVLPMKELRGPQGSIYITAALILWDEVLESTTGLDRQELVAATLKRVQGGLQKTLDATAPKTKAEAYQEERVVWYVPPGFYVYSLEQFNAATFNAEAQRTQRWE